MEDDEKDSSKDRRPPTAQFCVDGGTDGDTYKAERKQSQKGRVIKGHMKGTVKSRKEISVWLKARTHT
jgi:hypothetical protein